MQLNGETNMNNKSSHDRAFLAELAKLNKAQKEAVEHIDGPVLVIAGPGTGKTQILSARIGNILSNTQCGPHNILCLTYTDAGTIAMRKRLLKFIGPEAYRVHIYTFHAFCNQVIQENLDYFGFRDLQPISELETVELYQKLVDSFGPKHPLKRFTGEVYYEIGRLKPLFDIMKKEAYTSEYISEQIDAYLEDLPNREEYTYKKANATKGIKAGDLNERLFNLEKDKMELLRAAAGEYRQFEKLMKDSKRYDYNDMILWVRDAFRKNQNILLKYQERYLYFLVDEYQDTNGSQNDILNLLTGYWDDPNVFVVGDDDQSIYRFQGANVSNIIDFYNKHEPGIKTVIMTENYRSSQHILDAAGAVIVKNNERLVNKLKSLSKDLVAANKEIAASPVLPSVKEYYNVLHEEAGLLRQIEALHAQGEDLSEIAVIYRNHRLVENLVRALESKKIPLNIRQRINVLELPFVASLINILSYIHEEYEKPDSAEHFLYEIMHYHFFAISPRDIATITRESNKREDGRTTWRQIIASKERISKLNLESAKAISELEFNLSYWIKESRNMTVQVLFEKILTRGGVLTYIMNSPEKFWLMQVLSTFFDFIKNEAARIPDFSLKDLLQMIEKMRDNKIAIHLEKVLHAEKGVNFITAHSSKGLEFKHVFLISCTSRYWEKQSGRSSTYKFPDTITDTAAGEAIEEERRLFYVALTRAKEFLNISFASKENNDKEQEMSQFVAELLEGTGLKPERTILPDEEIFNYKMNIMWEEEKPMLKLMDEEFLNDALKNYKMSVTHLNKFLRCPLSFYFENILRVPSARSESMGFGNAVHHALFSLFSNMMKDKNKQFPSKEEFFEYFKQGMKNHHSHFTREEYKRKMEFGEELLPQIYAQYINEWHKNVTVEYRISNAEFEGVPITGALDKIEMDGNKVNVVDYKTGSPENGRKKLNPPDEKDPLGGEYWRQIVFYKILLDSDRTKNYEMTSGEIDFIQKDSKKNFSKHKIYIKPEEVNVVKLQIKDTYKKIMSHEFNPGCGEEDCQWCTFVKNDYKSEKLEPARTEE
jgi:DNA helicase II / ATP-dependent DNA helicase PcrA